jgi:hypothetical protein
MNEIDLSIRWFSNFAGVVFGNWWRFCFKAIHWLGPA